MQPNERITTGANDKAHIVFLDGSSLTIGPNSVLTIDKFVYDPERKTGELALNTSRGVFRFVGGAISKNSAVTIKTPSATMGIRGGIATFAVANNGATTANLLFGQSLTLTTPGGTTTLTQAGTSTQATGGSAPPTPPAPIPPGGLGNSSNFQQTAGTGNQPGVGQGNAPGGGGRPSANSIGAAFANYDRNGYGTNLNTGAEHYDKDVTAGRASIRCRYGASRGRLRAGRAKLRVHRHSISAYGSTALNVEPSSQSPPCAARCSSSRSRPHSQDG